MDEHYKVMITRLGTRLRAAGVAELAGDDVSIRASGPATVLRSLRELFPQAALACKGGAPNAWAGLRPMTPDGPPYLGATGIANLYLNVGQGSNGWTQACGCAQVVTDLVLRTPAADRCRRVWHQSLKTPSSRSHFAVARFCKSMSSPACRALRAAIVVST
jgi:D-amino-acid dehydrogenase